MFNTEAAKAHLAAASAHKNQQDDADNLSAEAWSQSEALGHVISDSVRSDDPVNTHFKWAIRHTNDSRKE